MDLPGAFVLASNDYYAPRPKNPLKYFWPDHKRVHGQQLPWRDLRDGMRDRGWLDLTNAAGELTVDGRRIAFAGVDDSHLKRDRYDLVAGAADPTADVRLGLAHSPEPRVLDRFAADGYDLLLCGHTHGGQLRVPFFGALVTNCGIDRERVRWLHRWTRRDLAARLGRPGHQPVRAGPVRLPARGDAADARRPGRLSPPPDAAAAGLDSSRHARGVAQLGSARRSGRRGRRFKSCHPDSHEAGAPHGAPASSVFQAAVVNSSGATPVGTAVSASSPACWAGRRPPPQRPRRVRHHRRSC